MMWFKFRTRWAWGTSRWNWIEIHESNLDRTKGQENTHKQVAKFVERQNNVMTWSDKYRGVEVITVSRPPKKVLVDALGDVHRDSSVIKEREKRLKKTLASWK